MSAHSRAEYLSTLAIWVGIALASTLVVHLIFTLSITPHVLLEADGWRMHAIAWSWSVPFNMVAISLAVAGWMLLVRRYSTLATSKVRHVLSLVVAAIACATVLLLISAVLAVAEQSDSLSAVEIFQLSLAALWESYQRWALSSSVLMMVICPRLLLGARLRRLGLVAVAD